MCDRGRRSDTSLFVRFAPKATFTNQDVIRRFVPKPAVSDRSKFLAYSMTSSARESSECGRVRPSAFAVVKLTRSSNLVG
jgi:hypothetical protein